VTWPATIKEEFKRIPAGSILFTIEDVVEVVEPLPWGDPTKMYRQELAHLTVIEPREYEGIAHEQRFQIGSDDDPLAEKDETRMKGGASRFQTMANKAGVTVAGAEEDQVRSELKDRHVGATVIWKLSADGFVRARVTRWFAPGEAEIAADGDAMKRAIEESNKMLATGGAPRAGAAPLPPRARVGAGAPPPPARPAAPPPRVGR
jgi:hypothetical protein